MMDPKKSMEDQYSKLHPCFPVNTRIGIVGAGPSGMSAAYALSQLGYNNVTVLEKHHTVGGMCESVEIEGKIYDLGGQVLAANSAPIIFHLAKETESELEEMDSHKFALIDSSTGKCEDMKVTDDYVSVINLTLKIQDEANETGRIGVHAVSDIASDPTPKFLQQHGFEAVPKSVAYGYTASGYGFVSDMPYAYIHEFTKTSMAGKIRRFRGGYTSLWEKLSLSLPVNVSCNAEVMKIQRNSDGIDVTLKDSNCLIKDLEFDKLIISGSLPFINGRTYRSCSSSEVQGKEEVLEMNEVEKELFSKVKTIDYYTTVMKINGLDHIEMGFYYVGEFMDDPATIGHPVAMQRFYADTNVFLFWSYGNSDDIKGAAVTKFAADVVKNLGGEVEKVILQRRFKYFPHVDSEDMKAGFYEKLEGELQGLQNTYYVGGLMAFELTERNSSYAMALVRKHFANDNPSPMFPYVKTLLPTLPSNGAWKWNSRQLDDYPEIQFPDLSTLDGYLKFWAAHPTTENKTLYTWLNEGGVVISQRSYKQLDANATQIAYKILTSRKPVIKPGDRVLLVHVPGLEFVDAFFGCLRAKVLPVPVLPPDPLQGGGQALLKIENICKACDAVAILSTFSYHVAVRSGAVKTLIMPMKNNGRTSASWPKLPWLHTDSWVKNTRNGYHVPTTGELQRVLESDPCLEDLCFLQFTSGSTGDAKGVMITHGGLIHNLKLMKKRYRSTSKTVLISWLPQYHDMGLIGGLFTALVSGGSAILFSPMTFIKNPLLWLQTMSKYRATHSAGPNFAFELVVRRLENEEKKKDYDLSSMVFLMVAAEPVRQKTLKRFVELTLPYGLLQEVMAPGYGLAENCVFVSCAFGEGKPIFVDWQGRVCCGYVSSDDPDVQVKIVDPETGVEHEEHGKEGEIWISSPSAGVGYWGKQEHSLITFGNTLANPPDKKFTRTGDLGRIIDGKLFITGRIKDLIIVGGRNIYASDVEKTVEASSDVLRPGCCAVIGVPEEVLSEKGIAVPESSDQVGLVAIVEVRDGKSVDKEVIEQIQTRVVEEHGVPLASVNIIQPRTISKTTSGKIRRFECLKQFTDGTLNLVIDAGSKKKAFLRSFSTGTCKEGKTPRNLLSRPLPSLAQNGRKTKDEIVEFLKKLVSEQTGIQAAKITATESLISYGIDSIGVVKASQKLSDFLGVPVGAVDIFTATCIEDLAIFSENLLIKSGPPSESNPSDLYEPAPSLLDHELEVTTSRKLGIGFLQLLAIVYISALLILPAYLSTSLFLSTLSSITALLGKSSLHCFCIPTILAPLAWMLYMFLTCASLSIFGKSFLQPNYTLTPEISIWSSDFVRWWALYKAQEIAGKVLAVHLRGTPFLNHWFEMLGARIGSSVMLDTTDITDPSLVLIGDGAVIAEGVLIQSHEVKDGILSFQPVKIGHNLSIGPYAVLQKGTVVEQEADVPPLHKTGKGNPIHKSHKAHKDGRGVLLNNDHHFYHFMGIYVVGFLSSLSASIIYYLYTQCSQSPLSLQSISFISIAGAFHWAPAALTALSTVFSTASPNPATFAASMATLYLSHGLLLTITTSISAHLLPNHPSLRRRIIASCHLRFAHLLSGTEAFCSYLRLLGSKIGRDCSIRAINPVADPQLLSIGNGVHLGDFCRIVTSFCSTSGLTAGKVDVQDNAVVGSQSVVLPNSVLEQDVILGALSIAPAGCVLQRGGVYVGSHKPTMVKNFLHALDDRIEEMDDKYKKIVGNLAANLAITTMKVKSRYFHRIGVSGKGELKLFKNLPGLPPHPLLGAGNTYPVLIRHSNSLSADDDGRLDARGTALRILAGDAALLDLTLKTGKAFYARTIADFASWLACGLPAREAAVARSPHLRDAVWGSLRRAASYADLHYYSNITRLLRFSDGREMLAKFKLRPSDEEISEEAGAVEPAGILPPETGAIPRDDDDDRPLLFLADDFHRRVSSPDGVEFVFQVQVRPVPADDAEKEEALDCTRPWDESKFPFTDIGNIKINRILSNRESEELEFNPFLRTQEVDIIRATSSNQSASIDHGRSLIYEICQHLRNGTPLPAAWKAFLDQSDVKVDLAGCPMAAPPPTATSKSDITLRRRWYQTAWAAFFQPLLQTFLPYFLLGIAVHRPLNWMMEMKHSQVRQLHWMLPIFLPCSGVLASMVCVASKWALVGKKREGETVKMWSAGVFMDTAWQAIRTVVGEYFMEMTCGSVLFGVVMKMLGADMEWLEEAYVDSMGAVLNPEMVEIGRGGCVGREALLFGHIYEGEEGKVKFGKVRVGEGGCVGSRAICMPGVMVEEGAALEALSLAMKGEVVRSRRYNI